ncbi:hypothetical protein KPATCC21470_8279 [Kitasatospora purpeofusca]
MEPFAQVACHHVEGAHRCGCLTRRQHVRQLDPVPRHVSLPRFPGGYFPCTPPAHVARRTPPVRTNLLPGHYARAREGQAGNGAVGSD